MIKAKALDYKFVIRGSIRVKMVLVVSFYVKRGRWIRSVMLIGADGDFCCEEGVKLS